MRFAHGEIEIGLSVVTVAELVHGACRARTEAGRVRRLAFIEELCLHLPVHAVTLELEHWRNAPIPSWLLRAVILATLFVASYRAWLRERRMLDEFKSIDSAPWVIIQYGFSVQPWGPSRAELVKPMSAPFVLKNLKDSPAFAVKVNDLVIEEYIARFDEVNIVTRDSPAEGFDGTR